MAHKITIKELATAAGVSVTTVSQILNGKSSRFSSDTIARVKRLQEKLNYIPNFNARNLILGEAKSIGVVVPNIGNPFFSSFIRGIQKVARDFEYLPFNFSGANNSQLEEYYAAIDCAALTDDYCQFFDLKILLIVSKERLYLLMDQIHHRWGPDSNSDKIGGQLVADIYYQWAIKGRYHCSG